jgi:aromatic-L-amino-acid decarboxylase
VLRDLDEIIVPGLTHWQSPNFFGYFPANTSGPAALGELLSAGLNVQGMLWAASPAATELETHVMDWMVDLLGLPEGFRSGAGGGGVIQDSASSAALCALLSARERATGYAANHRGCDGTLTAYASDQVHSSVEKAVRVAGLGSDNLRLIDVDDAFALRPDLLEQAILADEAAGLKPCYTVATIGTTSSNAMDPPGGSARSAAATECGCTSMALRPAPPPSARSSGISTTASSLPTAIASIRIS